MINGVDIDRAWIQTASGGKFHILDPQQSEINILDIAHALAMQTRFTGHGRKFYSVAEHCVLGSHLVPEKDALWFLLHDASEAFVSDISRPLKHFTGVGPTYLAVEQKIMEAIVKKFDLPLPEPVTIKQIDNAMLFAEKEYLLPPMVWDTKWAENEEPAKIRICGWPPEIAKIEFLHRFYKLTNQL